MKRVNNPEEKGRYSRMTSTDRDHFFQNDDEDTRCVQACYQMVVSRNSGKQLDMLAAETETGYAEGLLTWQFAMLYSLAETHGLYVRDHEYFDIEEFIEDPVESLRKQIDDEEALEHQVKNTDLEAEVRRAKACLNHPRIEFVNGVPTWSDLVQVNNAGASLIVLINGAALYGKPGYRPHSVVAHSVDAEGGLILDDPGPPPYPSLAVDRDRFLAAWLNPQPSVANYIAASERPLR